MLDPCELVSGVSPCVGKGACEVKNNGDRVCRSNLYIFSKNVFHKRCNTLVIDDF